ncbi:hypothetical protein [Billgrantia endophytica]|uniref:Propionate CoA-transferase n=1 Tax=Billgrantia endophytica TaxID=2033802 RepID=A0A2N7U2F6_9GAMM|nr:hypothetical protein [Halomonas endophytica]PMR74625.1 hypothetical protein C1H69_12235 [Halomonas endophytica]
MTIDKDIRAIYSLVNDQSVVDIIAFGSCQVPDYLIYLISEAIIAKPFKSKLGVIGASLAGGGWHGGLNTLALRDQIDWVVGGYYGAARVVAAQISRNKVTGYSLPQGIIAHAVTTKDRSIGISIGNGTFIQPENRGGKLGGIQCLASLVERADENTLKYKLPDSDIVLIRGKGLTKSGNVILEEDPIDLDLHDVVASAMARKAHILVQIPENAVFDSLGGYSQDIFSHVAYAPRAMHAPTYRTDYLSVEDPRRLSRTIDSQFISEAFIPRLSDKESTIIGIGLPVACINNLPPHNMIDICIESGHIGGVPIDGVGFGISVGVKRKTSQKAMFERIWNSDIDHAILGVGQCVDGVSINIARLGGAVFGVGGFIDIVQSVRKITFCNRSGKPASPPGEVAEWLCYSFDPEQDVKILNI